MKIRPAPLSLMRLIEACTSSSESLRNGGDSTPATISPGIRF
jgi:hypothetical protein